MTITINSDSFHKQQLPALLVLERQFVSCEAGRGILKYILASHLKAFRIHSFDVRESEDR
jgi:hypothetical protein